MQIKKSKFALESNSALSVRKDTDQIPTPAQALRELQEISDVMLDIEVLDTIAERIQVLYGFKSQDEHNEIIDALDKTFDEKWDRYLSLASAYDKQSVEFNKLNEKYEVLRDNARENNEFLHDANKQISALKRELGETRDRLEFASKEVAKLRNQRAMLFDQIDDLEKFKKSVIED